MTATATKQARTLVSRAVVWTGLAVGTAVTVLAVMNGIRIPRLEIVLSVLATWALLALLAIVVGELLRRHHRAIAGHAARHGKRGALAAVRGTRRGARSATAWLVSKAGPRWENREHRPLMFRKLSGDERGEDSERRQAAGTADDDCPRCGWPLPADGTCPTCKAAKEAGQPDQGTGPAYSWGPASSPSGWPADDQETSHRWARHMSTGGEPYVVTEYPPGGGPGRTIATYVNGKPAPDHADTNGGTASMKNSHIAPERRARRTAARTGGSMPAAWGPVIALAADFEPEDDAALLDWMNGQVTGMSGYGEALVDLYDHCTNVIGIDPAASALLHDVADVVAHAAEAMAAAKQKFVDHYELPREFAGNGGLMTHDGRWVTGEGA